MKTLNKYLIFLLTATLGIHFSIDVLFASVLNVPDDYETISEAIDNAEDNDTIMVGAGVYYDHLGQFREPDGLHIIGSPDMETIWDGQGEVFVLEPIGVEFHIENFVFREFRELCYSEGSSGSIKNCYFNNSMQTGISLYHADEGVRIEKCFFQQGLRYGVNPNGYNVIIRDCVFMSSYGIYQAGTPGLIENNLFLGNSRGLYVVRYEEDIDEFDVPDARNNIFIGCNWAVYLYGWGEGMQPVESAARHFMRFQYNLMWDNEINIWTLIEWPNEDNDFQNYWIYGESRPYPGTGLVYRDPMFVDVDNEDFHLRVGSPCIDAGDPESTDDPDGTRADIGPFYFDQREYESISIPLERGWNLISSHVNPVARNIQVLFNDLRTRGSLSVVKDDSGRFYLPEFDYNSIPYWDFHKGYAVKVNEADTLTIRGEPVAPDTPIPLARGWNTVAYFPEEEVEALEALVNIRNVLIFAKDCNGNFCYPLYEFNSMPPLRRNFGYQINVSRNIELIWNVPDDGR
ncbi:right-handed parallel beta-helix repeat-containing protein [bacterium]|nr:right-handed parallel beta-helix repeat-containing protein [bacterium]